MIGPMIGTIRLGDGMEAQVYDVTWEPLLERPKPTEADLWRARWAEKCSQAETLAAMVQRAAREIRDPALRSALLADLKAVLEEQV